MRRRDVILNELSKAIKENSEQDGEGNGFARAELRAQVLGDDRLHCGNGMRSKRAATCCDCGIGMASSANKA